MTTMQIPLQSRPPGDDFGNDHEVPGSGETVGGPAQRIGRRHFT